jgi:phage-related protein
VYCTDAAEIVVVDVFEKKTQATPKQVIEVDSPAAEISVTVFL